MSIVNLIEEIKILCLETFDSCFNYSQRKKQFGIIGFGLKE